MTTTHRGSICGILLGCAAALLTSSCGGGGGGGGAGGSSPPAGSITFSTSAVSFKAAGPSAASPAPQTISASVTGVTAGTLYLKIVADNTVLNSSNGLFTVSTPVIAGHSGSTQVIPAIPSSLGTGHYQGSITVTACLNDATCQSGQLAGSPRTIAVDYDIASGVDGDTVTPHVVAASTAGSVILRGTGFTGATTVSFGSVAATSMTVVSDSEIDASYPALPAGTYPVTVDSGSIGYSASLVSVAPTAFPAAVIPYPSGIGGDSIGTMETEYDAQRTALFILFRAGTYTSPVLLRYAFDGSQWGSPTQISMAGLVQFHLSPDGTHLLALVAPDSSHTSMVELDPVTLTQTDVTTVANPGGAADAPCGFALANDGNAIINMSYGVGMAFGTSSRTFTPLSASGSCEFAAASGNGAVVELYHETYLASSDTLNAGGVDTGATTTGDFAGDKFLSGGAVEDRSGNVLGYVQQGYFLGDIINAAGTKAYSITQDPVSQAPTLSTFDLTAMPTGSSQSPQYPVLGTPMAITGVPQPGLAEGQYPSAITPDGTTVFFAGPLDLLVEPVSP